MNPSYFVLWSSMQWGFPGGSGGKNLPAMWEPGFVPLGWEDPREEGMAAHSSILSLENP